MSNRLFFYPDYRRYVILTDRVIDHIYAHAQRRFWQREAGGEIYSVDTDTHGLVISAATGPNKGDHRGRYSYNPDIEAATKDRVLQFASGMHAVGLWHTHPESWPTPSQKDRRTTEEYLEAFREDRHRYLMLILGNRGAPPNMTIWSAEREVTNEWIKLIEGK